MPMDVKAHNDRVDNAAFFLLKDALKWARMDKFGIYLDAEGRSVLIAQQDVPDQLDIMLYQLKRSAISYLHSTSVEEQNTGAWDRTLGNDNEEVAP